MKITLQLMGSLKQHEPTDGILILSSPATICDALRSLDLAPEQAQTLTVNGDVVRDHGQRLADGDTLLVIPPVVGG